MKTLKIVLAGAVLVALSMLVIALLPAGESPAPVRIAIGGMTCEGCASKIQTTIAGLEGVEEASVNVAGGYADVTIEPEKVSVEEIIRAVGDAGYEASAAGGGGAATGGPAGTAGLPQQKGTAPPNAKLDEIRAQLVKVKNGMTRDGKYSCCISPSCDFCALATNGCVCGENLAKGKPVCGECKGGWMAGYGTNPDIDPKDVKALPDAEMKQMYRSRSELIRNLKSTGDRKE